MSFTPQDNMNGNSKALAQKQPDMKLPVTGTMAVLSAAVCPFIGLEDDSSTRLLFVSPAACCHRAEPVCAIDLGHQQAYCLTSVHTLCPVFMRPEWGPLPVAIEYREAGGRFARSRWLGWMAALVLLGLMVSGLFLWGNGRFPSITTAEPEQPVPIVLAAAATSTVTAAPAIMASATPLPTKTAVPDPTSTPSTTPSATLTTLPTATLVPTYTPVPPTTTAVPPITAVVNVERLNVRSGPGLDYDLVAVIDEGETVALVGRLANGSWWQICCVRGESGWVIGEALELPANAENLAPVIADIPLPPTPQPDSTN